MVKSALHEENRASWNAATRAHNRHKVDQATYLRDGGRVLFDEELRLLGDIRGKRLVHLQCNSGQDSLELARRGAEVTGVDISDEAIGFARELSEESGIVATFERADIFDWFTETRREEERFDIVFSSYGALCWISDVSEWAKGIARLLAAGGRLVLVEFHPMVNAVDEARCVAHAYSGGAALRCDDGVHDYVGESGSALAPSGFAQVREPFENPHHCHEFAWGIGDILQSVIDAGLVIETFAEHPFSNGCRFWFDMVELEGRRFILPEGAGEIPLMFSLAARRSEAR